MKEEYGIHLTLQENIPLVSAIVITVAHKIYKDWNTEEWLKLLLPQGVVIDIKNVVPAKYIEESG